MAPGSPPVRRLAADSDRRAVSASRHRDGRRGAAGVLETAHGSIPTPAFMPVGTKATVKSLHPDEVRALGASVILGNTYHLHFRPGEERRRGARRDPRVLGLGRPDPHRLGRVPGLLAPRHDLASRRRTASRSARSTTGPRRASRPRASPRSSAGSAPTSRCASTSACPPSAPRAELEQAVRLTTEWAERQARAPRAPGQLRFGISQGGTDRELRHSLAGGDRRAALRRPRARRSRGRGVARGDARLRRVGGAGACRRTSRATSWASATRSGSSRSSPAGSTCSTACFRRARRAPGRRSRGKGA